MSDVRDVKYKKLDIFRSNTLIAQSNKFSLLEQKLILTAIAQQRKTDEDFFQYVFSTKELSDLFEIPQNHLYDKLDEVSRSLVKRSLGCRDSNDGSFEYYPLMSKIKYEEGLLQFRFNQELKPLLLDIGEQYTILQLDTVVKLKSKHAIRLYEIVMVGKNKYSKKGSWDMNFGGLEELKHALGLYTEKKKLKVYKYPKINDFKKRVLDPAIEEINSVTDIVISYDEKKRSRKTVNIILYAKKKKTKLIKTGISEEEKTFTRLNKKLEKASLKAKKRFEEILKDFENQPNMFIKDPEIKAKSDFNSALIMWNKELSK